MQLKVRPSYWESSTFLRPANVAIVGGGLTGLQTALEIKERHPNWDVVILERSAYGQGASTRNAGFACFGTPTELLEDIEIHGAASTWDTVEARFRGIGKLTSRYRMHCDYNQFGGYEVFSDPEQFAKVKAALPQVNEALARITGHQNAWEVCQNVRGLRPEIGAVYNHLEGQINPAKLVAHLINQCHQKGVRMLFGTSVIEIDHKEEGGRLQLDNGSTLDADQIVLTTNAFTANLLPDLPIQPARNQVLVTAPIPDLQLKGCYHHERGYVYFRNIGSDRILIGGARHLAGPVSETTNFGPNKSIEKELIAYLNKFLQLNDNQTVVASQSWSGIIAQGGKSPIVKRHENGWVLALRLSGMGVALSGAVAERAAGLVCEQ